MRWSIRSSCETRSSGRAILAVLVAGLLAAGPVHASGTKQQPAAESGARARARALFQKAQKAYDLGKFEEAAQLYGRAYELAPLPGFLFNIAQCERLRGRPEQAAFFYRRFLEKAPQARNAALAQELLAQVQGSAEQIRQLRLEHQAKVNAESVKAEAPPLDTPAIEEKKGPEILQSWWLWTGVGLVAGAAGGATAMYLINR